MEYDQVYKLFHYLFQQSEVFLQAKIAFETFDYDH